MGTQNENATPKRKTQTIDERIEKTQAKFDRLNARIPKLVAKATADPTNVVTAAELTIAQAKLKTTSETLAKLQIQKAEASIPKEVRDELSTLRKALAIADKYAAPQEFSRAIVSLEQGIAAHYATAAAA